MIVTLLKTIPSSSHNAPYSSELGEHWPAGQQFTLLPTRRQETLHKFFSVPKDRVCLEQVGGEEVIVTIPVTKMPELFGVQFP
jgi:hypothetical protein